MPDARALPPPDFDVAAPYPEMASVRTALTALDWTGVRALVAAAPGPAARTMLIRYAGTIPGTELFLQDVLTRDADDAVAAAVLGGRLVNAGWAVRTSARAQYVSAEQFRTFRSFLVRAEQVLIEATARHPADPALWSQRLTSARGLEVGLAEVRRRYDRLAAADPHHLPAQSQLLQSLCPKWGGTWEQMHAFARERMLAAPAGAPNAVLVVIGHLERWVEDDSGRHLSHSQVRTEIYEAATRSVWDPGFQPVPGWVWVRNAFALVFGLLGDHRAAAGQFAAVGRFASQEVWDYLKDPTAAFIQRRAQAYAQAGAR